MQYILKISGVKEAIYLTQAQGEKLMLLLSQRNHPQYVYLGNSLVNTSFIEAVLEDFEQERYNQLYGFKPPKLTSQEEEIHQKYLEMKEKLLPKLEITPQLRTAAQEEAAKEERGMKR